MPETWPIITDPAFWAVAVPAALLIGLSKSGFAGGIGTLAVPLMALSISVPQAAAITLPILMAADITGLQQLWRERDAALLRILILPGLAGIVLGWLFFGLISTQALSALVGALTLLFLLQRLLFAPRAEGSVAPAWVGRLLALVSGFTSFIAHAGGPPISAYLLPMRLDPRIMAGTSAVFFAAINASKVLPYATLGLIDLRNGLTSLVLLPLAPLGVWIGVRALRRMDSTWFYRLAYACMALTGVKLLWDGLR
ncbi:MAG: sulfite exporter TauE/SafE family protein [Rubrivivax sp.]|nr:sulfite exporter TauE/SafE family protein [Rubrivivax sp.]